MTKIHCPFHEDDTASMHIYPDGKCFCFGCGKTSLLDNLPVKIDRRRFPIKNKPSDLDKELARIKQLPTKEIRGLELPYDDKGYYLVYPHSKYYIRRNFFEDLARYTYPTGHRKPPYVLNKDLSSTLFLVEGQINALTIKPYLEHDLMSPGAASMFNAQETLSYCLPYSTVCLILDKDAAGVVAGVELQEKLIALGKKVVLIAMPEDYNDVLCKYGKERLKEKLGEALALL